MNHPKTKFCSFLMLVLLAGSLCPGAAQTLTFLYSFTTNSAPDYTNSDGANPEAELLLLDGALYGTTSEGGASGNGTVFEINADGIGFTNLYSFTAAQDGTNSDGSNPYAGLVSSGGVLYGTAESGGTLGNGTLFAVNTDGSGFTNFFNFGDTNGAYPYGGLTLSGGTLYGTTVNGGDAESGTVFKVNTDGSGFTNFYSFSGGNDGSEPQGSLVLSNGVLYGVTAFGGDSGFGAIFAINIDGSGFTNLYSFTATQSTTNGDGANPYAGLVLSGGTLYGVAYNGGSFGYGTIFAINTDGSGFTNLYSFNGVTGANPLGGLVLSGGILYGTTYFGGSSGDGGVFQINTNGGNFTNFYSFNGVTGANPLGGLLLSGGILYGTTYYGGSSGDGTVFGLSLVTPAIAGISFIGNNLVINGINGLAGLTCYVLMSTNLALPKSQWMTVATNVLTTNGNFTITLANGVNPGAPQQYYILQLSPGVVITPPPVITGISLSGSNMVLDADNGLAGQTFYVLMSTNLALPKSEWMPVATNVLGTGGNFTVTVTNAVDPTVPERFYILQSQ
jgi:uncharacterized repeat protein (TIGR03803 family)